MTVKTELNMFFKPHPGLRLPCPICADMLLNIVCQGAQDSGWKKQKRTKNYADKVVVKLLFYYLLLLWELP